MAVKLQRPKGLDNILKNLNKEIGKIEGDVQKGLTLGMLVVKGKSMASTPRDTGNLIGSHYLVSKNGVMDQTAGDFNTNDDSGKKVAAEHSGKVDAAKSRVKRKKDPFVEIGCTAFYAEKVHEDLQASHMKSDKEGNPIQVGKAKFLEDAIKENQQLILDTVRRFARR